MKENREAENRSATRRLLPAALLSGSALFLGCAVMLAGGFAGAIGAFNQSLAPMDIEPQPQVSAPAAVDRPAHVRIKKAASNGAYGRQAMCVRLCDGFFFPSVTASGGDEACAAQCPDAPTAFYSKPAGSDNMDNAVSLTGESYSALPVANRHQMTFDNECACHRSLARSYLADLLRDRTLRKGDLVMTANGFEVFRGGTSGANPASSFVSLSRSPDVSKSSRTELLAMERAGVWSRQYGAYSLPESPSTADAPPRSRKGIVTVDDGAAGPIQ